MPVSASVLKRVHLFSNLDDDELERVAAISTEKTVAPSEQIIAQNTTGSEFYIVASGSAEVYIQGLEDARSIVVLGKGQVIGEMALIGQGYRTASVRAAKEGAKLYEIDSGTFIALCEEQNHIGYIVMRNLAVDVSIKLRHRNLAEL